MLCPECNSDNVGVIDVVKNKQQNEIYRQRKCRDCGYKFHTIEFEVEYDGQLKRDWHKNRRRWNKPSE